MKGSIIYKVIPINNGNKNIYIIDIRMRDSIDTHRYYIYDAETNEIQRVKYINKLLEHIQKNNKLSKIKDEALRLFIFNMIYYLKNYNEYTKKVSLPKSDINNFPGTINATKPDVELLTESFEEDDTIRKTLK